MLVLISCTLLTDPWNRPSQVRFLIKPCFVVVSNSSDSNAIFDLDIILDSTILLKFFHLVSAWIVWIIDFLFFFSPSRILMLRIWWREDPSGEFEPDRLAVPPFPKTSSSSSSIQISGTPLSLVIPLVSFIVLLSSFADSSPQIVTSIFGIGTELLRNRVGAERPSLLSVHAIPFNLIAKWKIKWYKNLSSKYNRSKYGIYHWNKSSLHTFCGRRSKPNIRHLLASEI